MSFGDRVRLEGKKVKKFQREKITTGRDITKKMLKGADSAPPPGSFVLSRSIFKAIQTSSFSI